MPWFSLSIFDSLFSKVYLLIVHCHQGSYILVEGADARQIIYKIEYVTVWWYRREDGQSFSHVWLFETPWTVACQAPLSMGFSRQEYWSMLPFLPSGDLPNSGMKLVLSASPALAGRFLTTEAPGKPIIKHICLSFQKLLQNTINFYWYADNFY